MEGFLTGIVIKSEDEEHQGMVQVVLSVNPDAEEETVWIPVMLPYGALPDSCRQPQPDDRVVVGQVNGGEMLIVIGYFDCDTGHRQSGTVTIDVDKKLILRSGGKEVMVLENNMLSISGNLSVKADDIVISTDSMTLEADKSIKLKSAQLDVEGRTMNFKASQGKLSSSGVLELQGALIKMN